MDNYKLSIEEYDRLHAHQDGKCYICGQPEPVKGRRLSVDHNHETGEIRGLLCSRCNPILGKIERAFKRYGLHKVPGLTVVQFLLRTALYAREHPVVEALGRRHFGYVGRVGTKAHRARIRKEVKLHATPRTSSTR